MALQSAAAKVIVKIPVIQCEDGDSQPALNILQIYAADLKGLIADDLSGAVAHDLIHQLAFVIHFCHKVGAGGNVCHRNSEMIRDAHDAHQVIILRCIQRLGIQIRSRRHNTYNFPFYQTFRQFRVFYLLADSHLITFGYQFIQVGIHCMKRNSAHGSPLFQSTVFSGQCYFQFS